MALTKKKEFIFITFNDGKFRTQNEAFDKVDGILSQINRFMKPIKGFKDKNVLRIILEDSESDFVYSIEASVDTQFGRMFAGHLDGITSGEHIQLTTTVNDRNGKGGSCFVEVKNGHTWQKAAYKAIKFNDADPEVAIAKANAAAIAKIEAHDAYKSYTPKPKEGSQSAATANQFNEFLKATQTAKCDGQSWPPFALHKANYEEWFKAIFKNDPTFTLAGMDEAQWAYVASVVGKHSDSGAPLPKPLRDLKEEEYDPFAD